MNPWHLYLMCLMYVGIGCMHFIQPKVFISVLPSYIPYGKLMVYLSGVAEIVLGIAVLYEKTRTVAIYGIMAMLVVFLAVHWHMIVDTKYHKKFPKYILWFRFILQFGLMYWAYHYIR